MCDQFPGRKGTRIEFSSGSQNLQGVVMTKTKLLIASAALLASTVLPSAAFACYCQASSPYAYGWGSSGYCSTATRIALRQCAIRSPRGSWCYISFCN